MRHLQYLFDKTQTGIVGPRFHERVGMTLRALSAAHGTRASLLDVPAASSDDAFMTAAVTLSPDDRLKTWWRTNRMEKRSDEYGQVIAWVNSKFQAFSETAALRAILGSGANAVDFAEVMDNRRIVLLDLSKSALGEPASRLLGFLYLGRVWDAALRRDHPERPFTVIVDEAHTLISGALTTMLSEGRKFGLSVVLAHQYLEQLDGELRTAVDGNVATTIAFRSAVSDAAELYKRFGGLVDSSVLVTQPDLSAVCLRTAMAGPAHPHTPTIDHNERVTAHTGSALTQHVATTCQASYAALVDPFRELTAAAATGASNITTPQIDSTSAQRPTGRPPTPRPAPKAEPASEEPPASTPSFLDSWIAKRAAEQSLSS